MPAKWALKLDNRALQLGLGFALLGLGSVVISSSLISSPISGVATGAALLVLAAVPLVGAVMAQKQSDVIVVRELRVIDENGTKRVLVKDHGVACYDERGNVRAAVDTDGLVLFDESTGLRAWIHGDGIQYFDDAGKESRRLGKHPKSDC